MSDRDSLATATASKLTYLQISLLAELPLYNFI